jgi:hypothetical protein
MGPDNRGEPLVEASIIVVLSLHLACVHFASAGPVIGAWLSWQEGRDDTIAGHAGRWLIRVSLLAFLLGALSGAVVGWLLVEHFERHYLAAAQRLPSKLWWGGCELAFYALCLGLCLVWWKSGSAQRPWQRAGRAVLLLAAGTNLLYHFPPLFTVIQQVATAGDSDRGTIDAAAFRALAFRRDVLSATLHFWGASFAVTGVGMMTYGMRSGAVAKQNVRVARWGAGIALAATLLQLPLGVWVLVEMPPAVQQSLLGQDGVATTMLVGSIIAAVALMHQLAAALLANAERKFVLRSLVLTVLTVLMMTGTLHRANETARGGRNGDGGWAAENRESEYPRELSQDGSIVIARAPTPQPSPPNHLPLRSFDTQNAFDGKCFGGEGAGENQIFGRADGGNVAVADDSKYFGERMASK